MAESRSSVPLVAHVVHGLRAGGLENGLINLINRTPRGRYRHAVICLTGYDRFAERLEREIPLLALDKREGKDPALYLRMWRALRQLRPDIVHTRNFGTLEMQAVAWLAGVAGRIHGEHGRDMIDLQGTHPRYLRMRRLLRHLVHRHVALSGELDDYLRDIVGVPAAGVSRICNGVDLARFRPDADDRAHRRSELGWDADTTVIGWVGRMEPVKDPLALAHAFIRVVERRPEWRHRVVLAMVGAGSQHAEVRNRLDAAGLSDRAWLPGPRDDIPGLLRSMDLFVLPSLAEGISNTILEAMASGLPVAATRVGGNAELVAEGDTGCLVPPGDADALGDVIDACVADPDRLAAQGRAARARAEDLFGIEDMVTHYLELYDKVLANARGRQTVAGTHSEIG